MTSVLRPQATALITGAASGVGFAFARVCRAKGLHLALCDINSSSLQRAKELLTASGSSSLKTEIYDFDVADRSAWTSVASQVKDTFGSVDVLMLNAGNSYKPKGDSPLKQYEDIDYWKRTLDTNVYGPLNGLSAILPLVTGSSDKSPKAIILTGSKQGITNPPGAGNPAYNSSKATVKHLAEHLSHDLRSTPATAHISVHLLIPGWAWTGLMGNVGPTDEKEVTKPEGAWFPSQVAEYLVQGLEKGSFYILCPDGETDRALDQARMTWAADDAIEDRSALSRWDAKWKDQAAQWIQEEANRRRKL